MSSNARSIVEKLIADGMTKADIGREIGYSRVAVSRLINDPGFNSIHVEAAVINRYSRITCPALKVELSIAQCSTHALAACPTSNARDVRLWKTCQTCQFKPASGDQS